MYNLSFVFVFLAQFYISNGCPLLYLGLLTVDFNCLTSIFLNLSYAHGTHISNGLVRNVRLTTTFVSHLDFIIRPNPKFSIYNRF